MAFPACADRARIVLHHLPSGVSASMTSTIPAHVYEVRPRKDKRGVDLTSDVLPFGRLRYGEPNAVSNAVVRHLHLNSSTVANGSADHGRKRLSVNFVGFPGCT